MLIFFCLLPSHRVESLTGLKQLEDAYEFQDGGENIDTAGVSVFIHAPKPNTLPSTVHAETSHTLSGQTDKRTHKPSKVLF